MRNKPIFKITFLYHPALKSLKYCASKFNAPSVTSVTMETQWYFTDVKPGATCLHAHMIMHLHSNFSSSFHLSLLSCLAHIHHLFCSPEVIMCKLSRLWRCAQHMLITNSENYVGGIGMKYLNPSVKTKKKSTLLKHIHVMLHEQSWIHKKLAESCKFYSIYLLYTWTIFNLSHVLTCHWVFVIFIQA